VDTLMTLGRRANAPEVLGAIRCPVLLIMAEGDYVASPSRAKKAVAQMTGARVETHWLNPRNHHHIFLNSDRAQTEQAIVDFLKRSAR
jgi:alpha-beta hydrolase superfamily lysophospholipase